MLKIAVFTDEPMAAVGLSSMLEAEDGFSLVGKWDDPGSLARSVEEAHPDLLLLDMASRVSLWQITDMRQRTPECKVVCWVRTIPFDMAMNLLQLGIRGLIPKTVTGHLLAGLLRRVAAGEHCIDDTLLTPTPVQALKLTGREKQILTMVSLGMKNKEMASALSISEGTLKVYVSRLLQKTGLRDRHQLALFRLRNPEIPAPLPRLSYAALHAPSLA